MSTYSLRHLTDELLGRELLAATAEDHRSTAALLARITEFDRRELYLPAGYKSMFRYCVGKLHMSEDAACQRIRAARIGRRFPAIFEAVADGRLNLTSVGLVASWLTEANADELLAAVARATVKQVRRLLAERFGRVPGPGAVGAAIGADELASPTLTIALESPGLSVSKRMNLTDSGHLGEPGGRTETSLDPGPAGAHAAPPTRRARLTPVAPGCFELVALLGQEAHDQLVASRDLLGHAVPYGDLLEVIERAIALQFTQLRKRRCGAADRPRATAAAAAAPDVANPRRVPRAIVRAVWERDGGQCAFVAPDAHRCEARDRLELDHIVPVARGGKSTAENLRLLCSAHNRHVAECEFGRDAVRARIETARRHRAAKRLRKAAERERAEARKAAMSRQDEELGVALRNLGYRGESLRRALAHCAERADAPPEARLRHALTCMAPNARREAPGGFATGA